MNCEIIISGFGGQGVLAFGQILSYSALKENKNTTWFPAYGPEQRGGTAYCTVVISDVEVASPISSNPDVVVAFNQPSLEKFESWLKKEGLLILNKSLIQKKATRDDIEVIYVDALTLARQIGEERAFNMILLGKFIKEKPILSVETVQSVIKDFFSYRGQTTIDKNLEAFKVGLEL